MILAERMKKQKTVEKDSPEQMDKELKRRLESKDPKSVLLYLKKVYCDEASYVLTVIS